MEILALDQAMAFLDSLLMAILAVLPVFFLLGVLLRGCAPHATPAGPVRFHYVDPPRMGVRKGGERLRLEVEPDSNDTGHLVFRLVGSRGLAGREAVFMLTGPRGARWVAEGSGGSGAVRIQGQVVQVRLRAGARPASRLEGTLLRLGLDPGGVALRGPRDLEVGPGRPVLLDEGGLPRPLDVDVGTLETR
jgi:hypothetical protein